MKLSTGYWQTYKEVPAEAVIVSHRLMLRAGLVFKSASGLYSQLPMGLRVVQKVERIVREEHNKRNCFELLPPFVTSGDLWKESGRWDTMGPELLRFKDRYDKDMCLSATNEEAFTDIFKKTVSSYKQLPVTLYQINTKFRDEIRPRYGVMRAKEFIMKDAYSFDIDKEGMDKSYQNLYECYQAIFDRCGLKYIVVEADAGSMADGQAQTHEFQVLAPNGEDKVIHCPACDYAANIEKAKTTRGALDFSTDTDEEEISTPNKTTIDEVCQFLKVKPHQALKSLVYLAVFGEKEKAILCLLLGDDELNEIKLSNHLSADHIKVASENDLKKLGLIKGFIGPQDLSKEAKILIDEAVDLTKSYTVGAGKKDVHKKGFVPQKSLKDFEHVDLRQAKKGDECFKCQKQVDEIKGVEVGHIFQLGDKYSKSMGVTVLDQKGKAITPLMGCYGVGVTRTVAAAIEQCHDDDGIIWPVPIAPYHVYLTVIGKTEETFKIAHEIYNDLWKQGIETILDDRKVGPGFKFKDSDLLGLPLRVVLGERDYAKDKMLEVKVRKTAESFKVTREDLTSFVQNKLKELS